MDKFDMLHSGEIYNPMDADLHKVQLECLDKVAEYNKLMPSEMEKRREMLEDMFAEFGEGSYIEIPFYSNWGGRHVYIGKHVYANYSLTLVDDTYIYIGDYTQIGPNVTLITPLHPRNNEQRRKGLQYNKPVRIGKNCWIGAGAMIFPGVTIGDNTIIGAGSVVTRDVPSNSIGYGNPCRYHPKDE